MSRRVVITGQGWITPLGHDVESVWARLLRGESGVGPVEIFDARTWSTSFAAQVRGFDLSRWIADPRRHHAASRSTRFLLAAAVQAWTQSGLGSARLRPRRCGMYLASGEGAVDWDNFTRANLRSWRADTRQLDTAEWARMALATLTPSSELEQEPNMALAHLAAEFPALRGPSSNCMTACAASTQAIGEAFELIRYGDADVMLAGGAHSMIHPLGMTGFIRLTAMSSRRDDPTRAARPFDQTRDGFVMGEGSAMVVLESLEHARARGATILAEVGGYGSTADAFRITDIAPEHRGAQAAVRKALQQAGIDPREPDPDPRGGGRPRVHWFCAHGTGTKENDKLETAAVKAVFGALAPKVPTSSIKSMLGHLIQAAGAAGAIACVQAIRTGMVPPTANHAHPDPECDLDVVPNVARDLRAIGGVEACLNNSAGFGGQNDVLLLRRFHPEA